MITAKQFRIDKFKNEKPFYSDKSIEYLMVEYAKEAIKADRENVVKHLNHIKYFDNQNDNKNLIFNAPNIELL